MNRRKLFKTCSAIAAGMMIDSTLFSKLLAAEKELYKSYKKALLIKENGEPLKTSDLPPYTVLLFYYPFKSTPCYIINVGDKVESTTLKLNNDKDYQFKGGIGKDKSIVAYSAICPHQWNYPNKDFSLFNYYPPTEKSATTGKSGVIQCCAHMSVFDVKKGGQVIEGPAELPLAYIELVEENENIYATAVVGPNQFEEFLDMYKSDLIELYGGFDKATEMVEKSVVIEVSKYVKEQIKC